MNPSYLLDISKPGNRTTTIKKKKPLESKTVGFDDSDGHFQTFKSNSHWSFTMHWTYPIQIDHSFV
jgi:hypothetical protein